ncbi:MAG TPA: nucleotidyltransferase family protein [Dehalococcoidia bacterium]|nr:nucleotidyltransferase family protein [Dehalococcoidia bacterium]
MTAAIAGLDQLPMREIEEFCRRWRVREFALFGSVLRDDFGPDSDVDVLLSFGDDTKWSLFDLGGMQADLEDIFGRRVDLVTREGLEEMQNRRRRFEIRRTARVVYAAA